MAKAILAIDQGTTGTTALVMGLDGSVLGRATCEFTQHYPRPGWVEHEPEDIWNSLEMAVKEGLAAAGMGSSDVLAIGVTNQRETTILWDRKTDKPIHRAIVWQDRRTADRCNQLLQRDLDEQIQNTTGLVIDPYFSATKIAWILDEVPGARERAERGELAFGTVDSYLIWRMAGGAKASAPHVTDVTNASRTLLFDLRLLDWSPELCRLFDVPWAVLPKVLPCAGRFAVTRGISAISDGVMISGVAGDQQAATFGQACFKLGDLKCTYGTGAFVVLNTGNRPRKSSHGLLSTVAWQIDGTTVYALEGSAFIAGAAVQWLRDGLGMIEKSSDIEALARSVPSSDGVVFVPALSGLGAPHWDSGARGLICGLTRGSRAAHIARATLEAIALQVNDLIGALREDLGTPIARLRVDGGAATNDLLMQFQSDVSELTVERPAELETTARGAAMLAGIGAKLYQSAGDAARMIRIKDQFTPQMTDTLRAEHLKKWADALGRTKSSRAEARQ